MPEHRGGAGEAGPASGRAKRSQDLAGEDRAQKSDPSDAPAGERRQSKSEDEGPSKRRADKQDKPSGQQESKAKDDSKDENRSEKRSTDDSKQDKPSRTSEKADGQKDKTDAGSKQSEAERNAKGNDARAEGKSDGDKPAKRVDLTEAKRDNLRGAFRKEKDLKPRAHIDVDISIGRRLPRDWDYRPVPVAVIEIVPEYRNYVFVYAEDEYVICDPDSYEVVAVIPAGGAQYAGGSSGATDRCPARLSLSRDERELILDEVRMNDEVDVRDLEVGWSVPSNVKLQRFPEEVLSKADELSACRYFVARDQLAIVDPIEEKVILVIDKS
jgi:hypothetical protein